MPESITPEQAAAILRKADEDKIDACWKEIERVLTTFSCIMEPQIIIRGTRIIAQMAILPNPTPNQGSQMQKIGHVPAMDDTKKEEPAETEK